MSEFRDEQAKRAARTTWYDSVVPELSEQQRSDLEEALRDQKISASTISTVLTRWGFDVSQQAVGNYRRRHRV